MIALNQGRRADGENLSALFSGRTEKIIRPIPKKGANALDFGMDTSAIMPAQSRRFAAHDNKPMLLVLISTGNTDCMLVNPEKLWYNETKQGRSAVFCCLRARGAD